MRFELPVKDCFKPQRSAMVNYIELSMDSVYHHTLQELDENSIPYDIWGIRLENEDEDVNDLPECLLIMDDIFNESA